MAPDLKFLCDRCGSYPVTPITFEAFVTTDEMVEVRKRKIESGVLEIRIRFHNGICPSCGGDRDSTVRTLEVVREKK